MMSTFGRLIRVAMPRQLISPHGLLIAAVALGLLFAVCHTLGWRDYTAFLSGTMPLDGQTVLGIVYAVAYFSVIIVVPMLVLAAVIFSVLLQLGRRGWRPDPRIAAARHDDLP